MKQGEMKLVYELHNKKMTAVGEITEGLTRGEIIGLAINANVMLIKELTKVTAKAAPPCFKVDNEKLLESYFVTVMKHALEQL